MYIRKYDYDKLYQYDSNYMITHNIMTLIQNRIIE